jgi:ankyrin repeat protein
VELGKRTIVAALVREMQIPVDANNVLHIAVKDPQRCGVEETQTLIHLLLDLGADINEVDECARTVLHIVKDAEIAAALVARGAKLEAETRLGETPLNIAVNSNRLGVVETLCSLGANPNSRTNRGQTPLFVAAKRGFASLIDVLLRHGADPSLMDDSGRTPLQAAVDGDRRHAVVALLQHQSGVNPDDASLDDLLRSGLARRHGSKGR